MAGLTGTAARDYTDVKEISSLEQWQEIMKSKDLNIIDVYASWCGPCTCLAACWRSCANANAGIIDEAEASPEAKGMRFWKLQAEMAAQWDEAWVETDLGKGVVGRVSNPCPCIQIYLKGEMSAQIDGADAPMISNTLKEIIEGGFYAPA